ncbi:hypothetical protein CRE_29579 [Caenorhabditis remanei]|uniref:Uncharacterized protein n=1 Tax=Caenorhabditis remanei TaxID=31234 RepID=E3LVS7_CAERE|nr:hypothetical protein CRE_29579 [Caenorhabditis remanei]
MSKLLVLLLSVFVLGTLCLIPDVDDIVDQALDDTEPMGGSMPIADCPDQVCPKGFYCRKGVCTYWQPIKKFADQDNVTARRKRKSKRFIKKNMRPGMNCKERYECPHGMTCTNGLCL